MCEITDQERKWFRTDICSDPPYSIPNHIRLKNPLIVEKMIFDIIHEFNQKLPFFEHYCKGAFVQLWIYLLREQHWNENYHVLTNWESLNEVKNYLSRHLDEEISIDRLAKMANLSKYYFIRMFKNAFGMTPSKYHQLMRIEKSKEWVQFTSLPLTEIAENFGFKSIHSFSRTFKKVEGVKPSFYRRKGGNI